MARKGCGSWAEHNLAKADYLRSVLSDKGKVLFDGAPRFHEFVLDVKQGAQAMNAGLLEKKIIGGLALGAVVSGAWAGG